MGAKQKDELTAAKPNKKLTLERKKAIKEFINRWKDAVSEAQDCKPFWLSLLHKVLGVENPDCIISFENPIKDGHTKRIDAYIEQTHVLIEQKSANKSLHEKIKQSGGVELTPFEQADNYNNHLDYSKRARYIVTCNFKSFLIYNMDHREEDPKEVLLENLVKDWAMLSFLVDDKEKKVVQEEQLSLSAGKIIGELYNALLSEYENARGDTPTAEDLHSLNVLCVRLVFCLYAEDAGLFGKNQFCKYLETFHIDNINLALKQLFEILNKDDTQRGVVLASKYKDFPYVNGDLFKQLNNEEIPPFSEISARTLIRDAGYGFDWSTINPTIFGAVFESTLNPETRKKEGMHYTSVENIHKVIDPLFLDNLKEDLKKIQSKPSGKSRVAEIEKYREKLGNLRFLDPACGSGNFLTETYICLRRLENEALKLLIGDPVLDVLGTKIHVQIENFHGIEINDFACSVAKTAMWIAECQMKQETAEILSRNLERLPLKNYDGIRQGNALNMDWSVDGEGFDYIIGNPPFIGASNCSKSQKKDVSSLFGKINLSNSLDYVAGWYYKAADFIQNTKTKCAFVSTNSISQGEQVAPIWRTLFGKFNIQIDYAYKTFVWNSESKKKAHVHCVIIGFSVANKKLSSPKRIYDKDGYIVAQNINPYLIDAYNFLIDSRAEPLCNVPIIRGGNKATGKGFVLSEKEKQNMLKKDPSVKEFIKPYLGADEYINGKIRYCLWLKDSTPEDRMKPVIHERLKLIKKEREDSSSEETRKTADSPHLFFFISQPNEEYILIPSTSSENRSYVPMGFVSPDIIASNAASVITNATRYHFAILSSCVHMAWMRTIGGRMKSDYRYTGSIVYNTFPWPNPTPEQKKRIEETAKMILDAREKNPNACLAAQYDEIGMSPELRAAHKENDKAVLAAYGFSKEDFSDTSCVIKLYELYKRLVDAEAASKLVKKNIKKRGKKKNKTNE